jgi:hypothetical protein
MATQYTDKDYFALQSALNQAAAQSQDALSKVTTRTDATVGQNIDYFKELAQYGTNLLAPYQALAKQSSNLYLDMLGVNGQAAQKAATPQAINIFNEQGINAAPLLQSIPGWAFNTGANQASSFMNSMFGYGTSQPTQQVSNQVIQQGLYGTPQQQSRFGNQSSAWDAVGLNLRPAPTNANTSTVNTEYQNKLKALQEQQAAFKPNAEYHKLLGDLRSVEGKMQAIQELQSRANQGFMTKGGLTAASDLARQYGITDITNPAALQNQLGRASIEFGKLAEAQGSSKAAKDYFASLVQDPATGKFVEKVTNPYDAQITALQSSLTQTGQPTNTSLTQAAQNRPRTTQTVTGPQTFTVPVLNQPQLQNQQNNELVDLTNRFKQTQNSVNDVAGNTQGALNQILGNAQNFGNTALGSNLRDAGGQLLNRFNNTTLSGLIGEANAASTGSMQSDITNSNRFLDVMQRELASRPNAAAEAGNIVQSGLDIGNRQVQPLVSRADGLMNRYMPTTGGNFVQDTLKGLIDPATGAVNSWMNSGVVKNVMDATINSGSNAVQNLAASRGMLDSGQTLAELQKVGTNAAGQYIVPYAGQLANNVLTQGANLAGTELQTGVNAAQNMYGLANQQVGNVLNATTSTANNRLNNYYNLLGKGMDFAQQTSNNRNSMTGNLVNAGVNLANTSGQLGAGMMTADQNARAGLMSNAIGAGQNVYGQNLNARTGMATSGLNFANNIMNTQANMAAGLSNQYAGMGNQFLGNLQGQSNQTANTQNALTQGGLSNMLSGGQNAASNTANIYSQLGGNVAGQNVYGNDIYGNATLQGAQIEANRLNQYAQLQVLMDQYDRAQKARNMGIAANGIGSLAGIMMMAAGGGL